MEASSGIKLKVLTRICFAELRKHELKNPLEHFFIYIYIKICFNKKKKRKKKLQ